MVSGRVTTPKEELLSVLGKKMFKLKISKNNYSTVNICKVLENLLKACNLSAKTLLS